MIFYGQTNHSTMIPRSLFCPQKVTHEPLKRLRRFLSTLDTRRSTHPIFHPEKERRVFLVSHLIRAFPRRLTLRATFGSLPCGCPAAWVLAPARALGCNNP